MSTIVKAVLFTFLMSLVNLLCAQEPQSSEDAFLTDIFSINQLKRDFEDHAGKVRIVTLLSPT